MKGFKKDGKFRPTENNKKGVKIDPSNNGKKSNLPDFNKNKEPVNTFGLSKDVIDKLKEELGNDVIVEDVNDGYWDKTTKRIELSDGSEWSLYKNYDQMEKIAKEQVRQDLEEEPEIFNQDFIESHQSIGETDARLFGNDFGNMMVEDRDLDELKEMADQYGVEYDDPDDIEDDDKREEAEEKLKEKLIDKVSYERAKEVEKTILRDGLKSFICDDEGLCSEDEFQEQYGKWLHLDVDSAVDDAVDTDGVEHFIARYDGSSHELKNGQYLVRDN
jgi:hypothetical protein